MLSTFLPESWRPYAKEFFLAFRSLPYRGQPFYCPCCDKHYRRFLPFGIEKRENAECPGCGSLERHRLLWFYLQERTNLFSGNLSILHFAPEHCLQRRLRLLPNLHYVSADLVSPEAMIMLDVTQIPFQDNSFDVILCNHVLEHIEDDRRAMGELFRVLKIGGWAVLQVPIDLARETTYEDPRIVDPMERERAFGQRDHVRVYGRDYARRLEEAGFLVLCDRYAEGLGYDAIRRSALPCGEILYRCTRSLPSPSKA